MRGFALITICLTVAYDAKRFVLLDPDDSNMEKTAANISDPEVRVRSLKMAKFRKWLKYDVDCDFISRDERDVKISQGRCPLISESEKKTTTTTKKPKSVFFKRKRKPLPNKDKSIFSHKNKESVVRAVVGNNKMHSIDLNPLSRPELVLVSGSMMTFTCDLDNRVKKRKKHEEIEFIEWFVNGKRIKPSWFDWRVSISWDGKLGIWPINEGDSGIFECLSNGQLKASVNVVVVPMSKVFLDGLINYLLVCAIFGLATISMGCLLGDRNVETKHTEVDRMEEFLEENVFKTDQMAKEKVKAIIADQGKIDERQIVENKGKGNRSTIMLLLQNANVQNPRKAKETTMNEAKNSDTQNKESSDEKPAELEKNKTELETKKKEDPEEEEDEDDYDDSDEEDEDVAADNGSSTTSKDSKTSSDSKTGKSKDSKKPKKKKTKKGKKKKDGKKKGTKNKKKGAGKGKKKASKGTKATAKKTKGTKKK